MMLLENNINIIVGGYYIGDSSWNNNHRLIDNCYKIYYVTKGEFWIKDKERTYRLREGGLYLVNGHNIVSYGSKYFETYWLHFAPQSSRLHLSLSSLAAVNRVSDLVMQHVEKLEIFTPDFDITLIKSDDAISLMKLQYVIYGSLLDTLNSSEHYGDDSVSDFHKVEPAIKYIDEFYTSNISLEELATLCHLSASHFHKIFTRSMQITPLNYLLNKKMIMALSLINMDKNFKEVAFELGFCNDAHFSRTFKKYFGLTPGQYKKYTTC